MSLNNEQTRAWIYRVLTAAGPIVTAYGIVDGRTAALWLGLAAAILGTGLAAYNTSTKAGDL
jgi:dipeptide/tripeptide permease